MTSYLDYHMVNTFVFNCFIIGHCIIHKLYHIKLMYLEIIGNMLRTVYGSHSSKRDLLNDYNEC